MSYKFLLIIFITILVSGIVNAQDTIPSFPKALDEKTISLNGFVRAGGYYDLNRLVDEPFFSSLFTDLGLKFESVYQTNYKALADIRFRYGSEFNKSANSIIIREAYIDYIHRKWTISAGQKILKWGRADFTNPTSKFNPRNLIARSPDREDMEMGNILGSVNIYPTKTFDIQAVIAPLYKPSILLIEPVPLPENTVINQIDGLITDRQMVSYGFRADFHVRGVDWGVSWFNGYDPMPGIALTSFNLDLTGTIPSATTYLSVTPYKTQVFGLDFEAVAGAVGIRGEAGWSIPYLSYKTNEYVPLQEVAWVAGFDWSPGKIRITVEYTGKFLPVFEPAIAASIIGTEPDYSKLAELLASPGFDINEYIRQQVSSFNRLYNYQIEKVYHSSGVRVESELFYGKIIPSLFTMYNFTSGDLLFIPELRYNPSDGLNIVAGAEIFSGTTGSLFDIINDFMNTIYISFKVDF